MRAWTNFVGAVVEAWQELRIHRGRVLLSLIGVAVAVCAITSVVGLGAIAEEASRESNEASGGRPADLSIMVSSTT
ncbi:MAG: putative transport system permease protein, partial [Actinomycetota bacterium]|nr:putative transport system permease protein [Actinomycetota bacterium]